MSGRSAWEREGDWTHVCRGRQAAASNLNLEPCTLTLNPEPKSYMCIRRQAPASKRNPCNPSSKSQRSVSRPRALWRWPCAAKTPGHQFSKVLRAVALYSKYTEALTCQNFCQPSGGMGGKPPPESHHFRANVLMCC